MKCEGGKKTTTCYICFLYGCFLFLEVRLALVFGRVVVGHLFSEQPAPVAFAGTRRLSKQWRQHVKAQGWTNQVPQKMWQANQSIFALFVYFFLPFFLSFPGPDAAMICRSCGLGFPWAKRGVHFSPLSMTPPRETRPHVVQQVTFKLAYSKKGNLKNQVKHDSEPKLCPEKKMTHQLASARLAITCETALNTFTYSLAAG